MQENRFRIKRIWLIPGAILIVLAAAAGFFLLQLRQEAYRSIQVYNLFGSAVIVREVTGNIEAYENLMLESGDRVEVSKDSSMRLKLDDDKYILAEENTVFQLLAEGNSKDSKTTIVLNEGAITSEIQNPLSEQSSYEISTPNSVMAVRGTFFRVAVRLREDGSAVTVLEVFDGTVTSELRHPDGTIAGDVISVYAGQTVEIGNNSEEAYYEAGPNPLDYSELPISVLEFLQEAALQNQEIGISLEELQDILTKRRGEDTMGDSDGAKEELPDKTEDPSTVSTVPGGIRDIINQQESQGGNPNRPKNFPENIEGQSMDSGTISGPDSGYGKEESAVCRVTFSYRGIVFGTQKVEKGGLAAEPVFVPAKTGSWDYDFNEPVTSDLEIEWN